MYKSIVQGTWIYYTGIVRAYCFVWSNSPGAQNDEIEYEIEAESGNKTLEILCRIAPTYAIAWVYLDDVYQGQIDQYSDPFQENVMKTLPVTVPSTGTHSLKFKVESKNPLATGWDITLTWIRIKD